GRRLPGQRHAGELAASDVERPVDENVEGEAAAGPELEHARTALGTVVEAHEPHPGRLLQAPDAPEQLRARVCATVERRHQCITHPPSIWMCWPVMNEAPSEARKATRFPTSSGRPRRFTLWPSRTTRL